jgi:hypothetical protein
LRALAPAETLSRNAIAIGRISRGSPRLEKHQQLRCAAPRSGATHLGGCIIFAKNARTLTDGSWSSMMADDPAALGFGLLAVTMRVGVSMAV